MSGWALTYVTLWLVLSMANWEQKTKFQASWSRLLGKDIQLAFGLAPENRQKDPRTPAAAAGRDEAPGKDIGAAAAAAAQIRVKALCDKAGGEDKAGYFFGLDPVLQHMVLWHFSPRTSIKTIL